MLTACMLPLRMLGLLILMLSLCDADSICPTELNPLTLDVPRVIERYGASVEVNCTSTEADHKGMYWRIGNNDFRAIPGESFISQSVSLSEWNVTAECRILLNETHECIKELEITIYQNPTVAVFPVNRAVEGTLFELQCNITDVAPVQNLVVRWFKDNQTIRTDNFTNTTTTPVSESSTLAVNISRAEHGAEFKCEAQLDFGSHGPQLPIDSEIYIVSVNYAPEFKNTSEDFFVHEGDDVTLNCDAEGRPQPTFHWKHDGKILSDTNNLNITRVNTSGMYNCSAINFLGKITKEIHVHVTMNIPAAPAVITTPAVITIPEPYKRRGCPLVLTPAKIVVRFGDPVSINCSTSVAVPIHMGWETTSGDVGDNETPDIVSVSALDSGPVMEGTEIQLKCDIINVTPVQKLTVRWYRGTDILRTDVLDENRRIPVNMSSIFNFTAERDYNGAELKCEADLQLETNRPDLGHHLTSSPYTAVVHFAPEINEGTCSKEVNLDGNVTLDCSAEGNPLPDLHWNYTTAENVRETTRWHQKSLTITGATSTNAGFYICVATNYVGEVTSTVTLKMKGQISVFPWRFLWWLLIGLIVVFIVIVIVIVHKYYKKLGRYSFVLDRANDGSDIPIPPLSNGAEDTV
ncbi:hemicentin-2-like isoform X2 [Gymnodraco acuticeps]|uniref:Hemicentin-2-like isoform X2 n=1 Tax=Gymnodraco acuticeps TaxID=8218 RepID=A0A6P8UJ57_GYMAC|nr:hemicentin-2-like isoform X2 [Gymnodraco acuticeps]